VTDLSNFILGGGGRMKKLIQVLIVCGIFVVMGGTASGETFLDTIKKGDFQKAIKLLLPLAEQGNEAAQYNLGNLYRGCCGNKEIIDHKEAVKWWGRASEQGVSAASSNMSYAYYTGFGGLSQDLNKALEMANQALEQGEKQGVEKWRIEKIKVFIKEIQTDIDKQTKVAVLSQQEIIDKMCSKESYPIEKNMIKVKGFYLGMSICDAHKLMTEGDTRTPKPFPLSSHCS
jgi:hypothetical protein